MVFYFILKNLFFKEFEFNYLIIKVKVSVIIPSFNRSAELKRCLESLVTQTYRDFEVIVCDDGSTDNTRDVVFSFTTSLDIKYSKDINFGGPARPRNHGIKLSNSDASAVAFLDSDDWWYPNKLEESIKYLKNYDIVYHDLDMYKNNDHKCGVVKGRKLNNPIFEDLLVYGNGILNSSVLIKKDLLILVGDFIEDKRLIAVEDADYWLRVSLHSNKFFYLNKSLGAYWVGDNISVSQKQVERMNFLLDKYIHLLPRYKANLAKAIQSFSNARTYHQLNMFDSAITHYKECLNSVTISYKVKSMVGIFLCFIRVKI